MHTAYLIGGVAEMRAICVQGGGGVKKGRKTACILYQWPLTFSLLTMLDPLLNPFLYNLVLLILGMPGEKARA